MVSSSIQTKFSNYFSRRPSSSLLKHSSLIAYTKRLIKHPQFFFQYSEWIPHVSPEVSPSTVSRTRTRFTQSVCHFSHASKLLDKMPHRKMQISDYTILRDTFRMIQSVNLMEPSSTNSALAHGFALKNGSLVDMSCATSLLTLYSRAKDFSYAIALFSELPDKDVVSWNAILTACIKNKRFEYAMDFFKRMIVDGNGFDSTTLVLAVTVSSSLKNLKHGHIIHGLGIKVGMLSDLSLSNAIVDMYAKCGDLRSSECMFAGVECKDIVTWNSIIIGSFFNNCPEKSLWYFRCANEADHVSISCAIAACTSLNEFDVGLVIHGLGIKLGYSESNHISVANSLISFYSQLRDIYGAECIFRGIVVKNVISWNSMIKGLFFNLQVVEAFALLHDMQFVELIQPDLTTAVTLIPFIAEHMLVREGKAAHGFTVRREMSSEMSIINSLINMYSKCNNVKKAEYLFLNLPRKDVVAWNTMISGYAQNGCSSEAQTLFKDMMHCSQTCTLPTLLAVIQSCDLLELGRSIHSWHIKLGFSCQIFAVNSLMHMYINSGALEDALKLFHKVSSRVDVTSWNTIIAGCTQKGNFHITLEYFELMRMTSQAHWNEITLVSVLSACANLGLVVKGKLIHGLAVKTPAGTGLRVQNALVTMYGKLGDTNSAKLAFDLSCDHNLCSWNCVISVLSQNDDAKKALQLFRSLNLEPDEITISTIVSACSQLGAINYGKQIHGRVFRFYFIRNPYIASALLEMYSNCGRLDTAIRVFQTLQEKSVTAYNSIISSYGLHNLGTKAIQTFNEMITSGFYPSNGTFTSLLSACGHSGLVDEGKMYYEKMFKEFKVRRTVEHQVCMVDLLGRSGRVVEAYEFIRKLPEEPEACLWGALLNACSYHGDIEVGREVAEILFALEPDNISYYVCLCNMYTAAGRWEEAVELRGIIQDKQIKKPTGFSSVLS